MGLEPGKFRSCWNGLWAVELALALSYLLTLGSTGAAAGLLMVPLEPPMRPPGWIDFDVKIDKTEGRYRAYGRSTSEGFEGTACFDLPAVLAGGVPCRFASAAPLRGVSGAATAADITDPQQVGGELFRTVFQGSLLQAFQGCLAEAMAQCGPGLRIRLRLNEVPELTGLPWEYLYDAEGRSFLALSDRTPVVRYLEMSKGLSPLPVKPPLRVLAVVSTPQGYPDLPKADEEWRRLGAALKPLRRRGLIEVERLERPTLAALEARLRPTNQPVHVLHFVGHGRFSEQHSEGVLLFEHEDGKCDHVSGSSLADLLQGHRSLRLAVLNACEAAVASREDIFAGTAQALMQRGVPAVIAMQSTVRDETACSFAEKFYQGIAGGQAVDSCVSEARRALAKKRNPEWGLPVLYLRAPDGHLFALS